MSPHFLGPTAPLWEVQEGFCLHPARCSEEVAAGVLVGRCNELLPDSLWLPPTGTLGSCGRQGRGSCRERRQSAGHLWPDPLQGLGMKNPGLVGWWPRNVKPEDTMIGYRLLPGHLWP